MPLDDYVSFRPDGSAVHRASPVAGRPAAGAGGRPWPPSYPASPVQQPRPTGQLLERTEIVPGRPVTGNAIPPSVVPLLEAATNRRLLHDLLRAYRSTYQPFFYGGSGTLADDGSLTITTNLHPDAYFVATQLLAHSENSSATYTVEWQDAAGQTVLSGFALHNSMLLGDANQPYWLPREMVFPPGGTVRFDLADLGTGADHVVRIAMAGYKVFVAER